MNIPVKLPQGQKLERKFKKKTKKVACQHVGIHKNLTEQITICQVLWTDESKEECFNFNFHIPYLLPSMEAEE